MGKNRPSKIKLPEKGDVAVVLMAVIFCGFLFSRLFLSVGMFLFGINCLRDIHPRRWLLDKWWLLSLVWLLWFGITWYWSSNKAEWGSHIQVKLPFLLLPLAFGFLPALSRKQWLRILLIQSAALVAGCAWSLSFLLRDPQYYVDGYKVSHLLPTPAYNDHIAFSMAVALGIVALVQSWPLLQLRWEKVLGALAVATLAIYLHILAAKSGLLAFYVFTGCMIVYLLLRKRLLSAFAISAALFFAGWLGTKYIPTLRLRMEYIRYSVERWQDGHREAEISDAGRAISYDVALRIIHRHPMTGVGAGDMRDELKPVYQQYHPGVEERQMLLPHNQFMIIALGAGIGCAAVFALWIMWPLFSIRRSSAGFFMIAVWLMLLIPLFTDPFLEVQFGVCVYLMFLLWHRHHMYKPTSS